LVVGLLCKITVRDIAKHGSSPKDIIDNIAKKYNEKSKVWKKFDWKGLMCGIAKK
jgi:hypothetical protein